MDGLLSLIERLNISSNTDASTVEKTSNAFLTVLPAEQRQEESFSSEGFKALITVLFEQVELISTESSKLYLGIKTLNDESAFNSLIVSFLNKSEAVLNTTEAILNENSKSHSFRLCKEFKSHYSDFNRSFCQDMMVVLKLMVIYANEKNLETKKNLDQELLLRIGVFQETCTKARFLPRGNIPATKRKLLSCLRLINDTHREFNELLKKFSSDANGMNIEFVGEEIPGSRMEDDESDFEDDLDEDLNEEEAKYVKDFLGYASDVILHLSEVQERLNESNVEINSLSIARLDNLSEIFGKIESKISDLAVSLYPPIDDIYKPTFLLKLQNDRLQVDELLKMLRANILDAE